VIERALAALGLPPDTPRSPVSGGDIHQAWRVDSEQGRLFVKTNARPLERIFELEAAGLEALRAADSGLGVPSVLGVGEQWLALGWIERGAGGGAELGEGLARLHRSTADKFGWDEDNWIASLVQPNGRWDSLPAFFGEQRLRARAACLPWAMRGRLDRVIERLADLLPDEPPALLHGDLWGGNWMADAYGTPWVFDPAVHHGCREVDLAMTTLFGGFPPAFYEAYEATWPLAPGWRERTDLWNLHPLLVHVELFGGGYVAQVDRILRRFAG
jgi:protein-ribulosamine 3-kinase